MFMRMLQLDPSIPVYVIDKGVGEAIAWFDYSKEDHLLWLVCMNDTGEMWLIPNPQIRLQSNPSLGRILKKKE